MTETLKPQPSDLTCLGSKRADSGRRIGLGEGVLAARRTRRPIVLCCQATRAGHGETFLTAFPMASAFQASPPLHRLFVYSP